MSNAPSKRAAAAEAAKVSIVHDFDRLLAEVVDEDDELDIVFQKGGKTFRVPPVLDWPAEVIEMQQLAATNPAAFPMVEFTKRLLGEQYADYEKVGGTPVRFLRFMESVKLNGSTTVGEASAS